MRDKHRRLCISKFFILTSMIAESGQGLLSQIERRVFFGGGATHGSGSVDSHPQRGNPSLFLLLNAENVKGRSGTERPFVLRENQS